MATTWIILADESVARIINACSLNEFKEIDRLDHPAGRLHNSDLTSDRPGRSFESTGTTRHSIAVKTPATDIEAQLFAREVVAYLDKARIENRVQRLYLVAPQRFLGFLRAEMQSPLEALVVEEVGKELTTIKPNEIKSHIYVTFGVE